MAKTLSADTVVVNLVNMTSGSADPTAGGGVAAPIGSLYLRTDGTFYTKTGAGATAWTINAPVNQFATTATDPSTGAGRTGAVGDIVVFTSGTSSEVFMKMSTTATDWQPLQVSGSGSTWFGDGRDGSATISVDTDEASTTGSAYYQDLTIDAGITYRPQSRLIYVAGTLFLNGIIQQNGSDGAVGIIGSAAGGAAGGVATQPVIMGTAGGSGSNGGGGAGDGGTTGAAKSISTTNGIGGNGGAYGTGGTGAPGNGGTATGWTAVQGSPRGGILTGMKGPVQNGATIPTAAPNGGTGGGGGGGAAAGGGGGGGGGSGNIIIYARRIEWGAAGVIQAKGGAGGAGYPTAGNTAGGGGGGGGKVFVLYRQSSGTATLTVTGGTGGAKRPAGNGNNGSNGNDGFALTRVV